jgi:cysteine desulfuration protein SufE
MARAEYDEFAETLEALDDEDMRFEYILDLAKAQEKAHFPEEWMTDQNLMHGCMSRVWIVHQPDGERHIFHGASEAAIVKGLVHMMTNTFSGLTAEEIAGFSVEDIKRLNLGALTFQRQVGMMAMLKHMQKLAGRQPAANEA